jgi:hypothetical protein
MLGNIIGGEIQFERVNNPDTAILDLIPRIIKHTKIANSLCDNCILDSDMSLLRLTSLFFMLSKVSMKIAILMQGLRNSRLI